MSKKCLSNGAFGMARPYPETLPQTLDTYTFSYYRVLEGLRNRGKDIREKVIFYKTEKIAFISSWVSKVIDTMRPYDPTRTGLGHA